LWVVALEVPAAAGEIFAEAFAQIALTFSALEAGRGQRWRFEALIEEEPDRASLELVLGLAAAAAGCALPELSVAPLPARNWLADNRRQFPPTTAGRFFVHGSFFAGRPPAGRIAIALDAGLAFGSGTHETTRGCLLAIDRLARRKRFRHALDLGCGSGILAIGIAKLRQRPVMAVDNDPVALDVARANARRNGVARFVRPVLSNGLSASALRAGGRYDLVVANILARPLERLARALAHVRHGDGILILSGILACQAPGVLSAYRAQGLALKMRIGRGEWTTLVIGKAGPRRAPP